MRISRPSSPSTAIGSSCSERSQKTSRQLGKIAANEAFGLEATSRVKRFVFRFVQVPFRWVFRGRQ